MLIVDYIAVALLLVSGTVLLRTGGSPGLLCGAWGFEFCLNYRTFFSRMEVLMSGGNDPVMQVEAIVLGSLLGVTAIMFFISMYYCYEQSPQEPQTSQPE